MASNRTLRPWIVKSLRKLAEGAFVKLSPAERTSEGERLREYREGCRFEGRACFLDLSCRGEFLVRSGICRSLTSSIGRIQNPAGSKSEWGMVIALISGLGGRVRRLGFLLVRASEGMLTALYFAGSRVFPVKPLAQKVASHA